MGDAAANRPFSDLDPSGVDDVAGDGVAITAAINGQDWRVAWYPAPDPPSGTAHGAAAVCLAGDQLVLVSGDGEAWDLPAGRPEPGESALETLRREIHEEACATVASGTLLGFSQGTCIRGDEQGLILVRSLWQADVVLDEWRPQFEIAHRRLVPCGQALEQLLGQPCFPHGLRPLYRRIFAEAGLPISLDESAPGECRTSSLVIEAARQLALGFAGRLASRCSEALEDSLVSVILHGSLVLDDFTPGRSDIDLLVVVEDPLSADHLAGLRDVVDQLRRDSATRVDLRVVTRATAGSPTRVPPMEAAFALRPGKQPMVETRVAETDLVVEFAVARAHGRSIVGGMPAVVIGPVPD